jgi:hypothetical protein
MRRRLTAADGTEWTVGRVWFGQRRMKSWAWRRGFGSRLADGDSGDMIISGLFDGVDLEDGLVVIAAGIALIFIVVPLLLFGLELIILGIVLGAGLVGRSLFGKPWTVTAAPSGDQTPAAVWRVKGWHRSAQLIDQICTDIEVRGKIVPDFPGAECIERSPASL